MTVSRSSLVGSTAGKGVEAYRYKHQGMMQSTRAIIENVWNQPSQISQGMVSIIQFYISHSILLALFFIISIYSNIQYIYHRIFIKFLTLAYYPNKTPQIIRDDVNKLNKIPKRVATILDLKDDDDENGGIDGLINDISELIAWNLSSGIPQLIIYEYNGIINNHLQELQRYINKNLSIYFGTDSKPNYLIKIPHSNKSIINQLGDSIDLEITLLLKNDGKQTIVELTKTMGDLASNNELSIKDITIDLINEELIELVGLEPDLLISFGPNLDLQNYPPWHIRLLEIYWQSDNINVNYAVFIRALQKYSHCKINIGK